MNVTKHSINISLEPNFLYNLDLTSRLLSVFAWSRSTRLSSFPLGEVGITETNLTPPAKYL